MSSAACTIFGTAILALLLAGYLAQHFLPPPKPRIVGIDLGTTFSCIGVYQAGTGEVSILENADEQKCIPSVVAFSGDDILVGYKAAAQADHNPSNTIFDAKRFIGKQFSKDELEVESGRYPFKMGVDKSGQVYFEVQQRGRVTQVTPEFIGSRVLGALHETAERNLSVPVNMAVVSVPAEFDDRQRNATRKAASLTGLDVLRIINEPTAAALAYGLHKKQGIHYVIVVDLGGGTLDVSLLGVQGGMFLTQAMAGNNHLGGQDFNQRLMDHILKDIQTQFQRTLTDPEDIQSLRSAVEKNKQDLTYQNSAVIDLDLVSFRSKLSPKETAKYSYEITKDTFEKLNFDLFEKVLEPIKRVLEATELNSDDIDEIVLVGGSTRIPKIRQMVKNFFQKEPNVSVDPELAVVTGGSIQAGILGGAWPLQVSALEVKSAVKKIHLR